MTGSSRVIRRSYRSIASYRRQRVAECRSVRANLRLQFFFCPGLSVVRLERKAYLLKIKNLPTQAFADELLERW
jgi:hypothetical protein